MDKIIFQNTDDFTALYKNGKYADKFVCPNMT